MVAQGEKQMQEEKALSEGCSTPPYLRGPVRHLFSVVRDDQGRGLILGVM